MKIALLGNQNSGKTTLFNNLTGFNSKVGNYPGVSVDEKSGYIKNTSYEIIDLPGIYSLNSYGADEEVTINYILNNKIDLIINIIDSNTLERSLNLTLQLLDLDINIIVVLNMNDLLLKKGIIIDENILSNILGVSVIKISASKNIGIDNLLKLIESNKIKRINKIYDDKIEQSIYKIQNSLNNKVYNKRFVSIKLLENEDRFNIYKSNEIDCIINSLSFRYENNLYEEIIYQRFKYIENIKSKVYKKNNYNISMSEKLDKIFLNKYLSFPIFILIMSFIFYLSINLVGNNLSIILEKSIENFSYILNNFFVNIGVNDAIISLFINGIVKGVLTVLTFLPQLMILFFCLSILESSGYMSRIEILFDNIFRKIGLNGKSIVPFIIGLGCSVPGILGCRTIENKNIRNMTCALTPFVPCSAKLPIIIMLSSYFYKEHQVLIIISLYLLSIFVIIISAIIMRKYFKINDNDLYLEELVEYKMIDIKYVLKDVYNRSLSFIKRAGTIIFLSSIIVWFLSSFSLKFEYGVSLNETIIAFIGKKISWFFVPLLGINSWEASISIIQGLIAKEQVVSSLSIINELSNNNFILSVFNNHSAYSFIVFNLFSVPCISSLYALKKELKNKKIFILLIFYQIFFAWLLSIFIYNVLNNINILIILILIIIVIILFNIKKSNCDYCAFNGCCRK